MYLVHAQFAPPAVGGMWGEEMHLAGEEIRRDPRVQHVSCHPDGPSGPVLGVFVLARTVEAAEEQVAELCHTALRASPGLSGWRLARCEVVLSVLS
ncbi:MULTISPECIES: hypothetical protein [Streptomyces]|uniref:YCII-related domain-containing protein n=1 Tax=Streptomyces venezuelae TaxID=54571 RepID=A0A5P2AS56_STRVZ|nr:hypothetical protein [Streptomyces venezuelae]QES19079.1 hypothetical protein DEJ46_08250 [Streptomyces venezuelae]